MTYPSVSRWLADRRVRTAPRSLPLGTRRTLGLGAGALTALTLAASILPLGAAAADTSWSANCSARLRTSATTSAGIKKTVPAGTVITASAEVAGSSYSASCGTSVSGNMWLRVVSVGGKSVSSLYGVSYLYSAKKLYKSASSPTAPPPTSAPATSAPATPKPTVTPTAAPTVTPTAAPTVTPTAAPTVTPTAAPTTPPTTTYLFSDEFNGASLDASKWRASNYGVTGGGRKCCGDTNIQKNYASEVSVGGGYLHLGAHLMSGIWHTGTIDTETKWLAQPGQKWEARIKLPRGYGFWPAFWGYTNNGGEEIDVLEVCSGAPGTRNGNDETLLHQSVHYDGTSPRIARDTRHSDLSTDWHVFGVDWRSGTIKFYLDGVQQSTSVTSNVPTQSMPIILNFGVGGTWCGNPDSTTPTSAEMLVDWVRVSP